MKEKSLNPSQPFPVHSDPTAVFRPAREPDYVHDAILPFWVTCEWSHPTVRISSREELSPRRRDSDSSVVVLSQSRGERSCDRSAADKAAIQFRRLRHTPRQIWNPVTTTVGASATQPQAGSVTDVSARTGTCAHRHQGTYRYLPKCLPRQVHTHTGT